MTIMVLLTSTTYTPFCFCLFLGWFSDIPELLTITAHTFHTCPSATSAPPRNPPKTTLPKPALPSSPPQL